MHTMGSPRTLNDVLMITGHAGEPLELADEVVVERVRVRASPSGCGPSGRRGSPPGSCACPRRTWADEQHVRALAVDARTTRAHFSASTEGAKGRKPSRNLIFMLRVSRIFGSRGSARMQRRAERPRPELHAALEPADHVAVGDAARAVASSSSGVGERLVPAPRAVEVVLDLSSLKAGRGRRASSAWPRGFLCERVVDVVRDADRAARVAGRGLDEELLHRASRG